MKKSCILRVLALLLVFCVVIGLTACGGSKGNQTKGNETSKETGNSGVESKKLVFWNLYYNTQNETDKNKTKDELFVNKAAKRFEDENPGLTVEILTPPMDNYFNMLKAACVAKNGPDVAMNWTGGPLMDYAQFVIPLNDYYTEEEISQLIGWEMCRKDFKPDGDIIAVPVGMNGGLITVYYNKALFRQAGIDPECTATTWDELLALCADLKKEGVTPFILGEKEGWNTAWALSQLWTDLAGTDHIISVRNGNMKFVENNAFKEAFLTWKKLYDLGYTNVDVVSTAQADGQGRFLAGEGAMEIGWAFLAKDVYNALGEDAGTFPFPHVSADSPYANTYIGGYAGYCFTVTNFSSIPDESVKFIKFMTSSEIADWFVEETQFDFSNNVNSKDPDFEDNPIMDWMWNYMKTTDNKPAPCWDNILQGDLAQEIYNMSGAVFGGKMDIDEALKRFDEKLEAILKE
jgi:ABC-type glycerol-3-phosphate transport system substrate-binding protein